MNGLGTSQSTSFSAPDHLYTWLDVESYFSELALLGRWPAWLREVDGYWDQVTLSVDMAVTDDALWSWLSQVLGPLTVDAGRNLILLDDGGQTERTLPVEVRRTPVPVAEARAPRFGEGRVTLEASTQLPVPAHPTLPHGVAVCAFHSFKGGVGRTLHCVAVARRLAARNARVLLVDGDLEAPGITWMLEAQGARTDFSWEDMLALVHGSPDDQYSDALVLGRKFLTNQELDDVIVMPSRREYLRVAPARITPTDLLTADRSPYVVTETLAQLAHQLHAEVVLIDLRAGISELSAPILLDPRVHRVFVSTVSDQSVRGTRRILDELARKAPANRATDAPTTLILTQFHAQDHFDRLGQVAAELRDAAARAAGVPIDRADELGLTTDIDIVSEPILSPFNPTLLNLPASWTEVYEIAAATGLGDVVRPLVDLLAPAQPRAVPTLSLSTMVEPDQLRRQLAHRSERLVFAETAHENDLLVTDALTNLVTSHRVDVPIEVVVGSKGSGKTFTFLHLCRTRSWRNFARSVGNTPVEVDARVVPVLMPINLDGQDRDDLRDAQVSAAEALTTQEAATTPYLHDLIRTQLGTATDDVAWRRLWLTCLARAVGLNTTPDQVETVLADFARKSRAVFVIDGLEDLFQDFTTNAHQQQALRVLLQDCPEWLRTLRGRPLGFVVFVRRDLVENSIKQNVGQFLARHQPYELRWNRVEALRLAAWVSQRARAVDAKFPVQRAGEKQLSEAMIPIWGEKMGSASSREARSDTWFLVALSDFNQQIQARDIVSFLRYAAEKSVGDSRWNDRLITPTAMRDALPECSREKIGAIQIENPPVGKLLERLRTLPADARRIPFTDLDAVSLRPSETRLLETNGVLFKEGEKYWMPEIFRHGLNFKANGRPRVVTVANLAYRRASL